MPILSLANLPDATILALGVASDVTLNGSDVAQLDDLSGGGNHFVQATEARQPAYTSANANYNNKPTISFTIANEEFLRASALNLGTSFTVVMIGDNGSDLSSTEAILGHGGVSTNMIGFLSGQMYARSGAVNFTDNATYDGTPAVWEYRVTGGTSMLRRNGVERKSGSAGAATWSDIYLGRRAAGDVHFGGNVAAILIVSGELSSSDRRLIYQYAQQQFGIALPYPQTAAPTPSAFPSASVNHNVNMPPVVKAGDLLLVQMRCQGAVANGIKLPTGWTRLSPDALNQTGIFAKLTTGSEGGTTINFMTNNAATGSAQTYRITEWYGSIGGGIVLNEQTTGSGFFGGTSPNPGLITVPWGPRKNLFFALGLANDDDVTFTDAPASYTDLVSTISGGGTNNGASVGSARRELQAASDNPGPFTLASDEAWSAFALVVRPIAAVPLAGGAGIMAGGL